MLTGTSDDLVGHGTHVAGIISAKGNNGIGLTGLAWGTKVMPLRVFGEEGGAYWWCIQQALLYAADSGVDVVNLSLGNDYDDPREGNAVAYALSKGVVVVASAGNCGDPRSYLLNGCRTLSPPGYPASYPGVIAVAAVGDDSKRAAYSSYGPNIVVDH